MAAFQSILAEPDPDSTETAEWIDAARGVVAREGPDRVRALLDAVADSMRRSGTDVPYRTTTAYVPPLPDRPDVREGIVQGMYLLPETAPETELRVQLLGSGPILREVLAAAERLEKDWGVGADVWSVTSFTELRRDGLAAERWNLLHPEETPRLPYVSRCLTGRSGPVIAASDYLKTHADQIRAFVPGPYHVLGTDGFGRSDDRPNLRRFFEVDDRFIAFAALSSLAREGLFAPAQVASAAKRYGIDVEKPDPLTV